MKKLLLSFLCFVSFVGLGMAQDVQLDFTSNAWNLPTTKGSAKDGKDHTYSNGEYSVVLNSSTGDGFYYNSQKYLMLGKTDAYLQLPAFDFNVSKIEVVGRTGASGSTGMNVFVGDVAVSKATTGSTATNSYDIDANYQAAGNLYKIKVTSNHNAQITKVLVYAAAAEGEVAKVTFSPVAGAVAEGTEVALECATEGASIYYTVDGNEPTAESTLYAEPIVVNEAVTIKAVAAVGDKLSEVSEAAYTVIPSYDSLEEVLALAKDTKFVCGVELSVYEVQGSNVFVYNPAKEEYALIYKYDTGLQAGQTIKAGWIGTIGIYGGLPQLVPSEALEVGTGTATMPEVEEVTEENVAEVYIADNIRRPYIFKNVKVGAYSGKNCTGTLGETSINLYNNFNITTSSLVADAAYDVYGILNSYNGTVQLNPITFTEAEVAPEAPDALYLFVNDRMANMAENVEGVFTFNNIDMQSDGMPYFNFDDGNGVLYGAVEDNTYVVVGEPYELAQSEYNFTMMASGTYNIVVDWNEMTVTVTEVPAPEPAESITIYWNGSSLPDIEYEPYFIYTLYDAEVAMMEMQMGKFSKFETVKMTRCAEAPAEAPADPEGKIYNFNVYSAEIPSNTTMFFYGGVEGDMPSPMYLAVGEYGPVAPVAEHVYTVDSPLGSSLSDMGAYADVVVEYVAPAPAPNELLLFVNDRLVTTAANVEGVFTFNNVQMSSGMMGIPCFNFEDDKQVLYGAAEDYAYAIVGEANALVQSEYFYYLQAPGAYNLVVDWNAMTVTVTEMPAPEPAEAVTVYWNHSSRGENDFEPCMFYSLYSFEEAFMAMQMGNMSKMQIVKMTQCAEAPAEAVENPEGKVYSFNVYSVEIPSNAQFMIVGSNDENFGPNPIFIAGSNEAPLGPEANQVYTADLESYFMASMGAYDDVVVDYVAPEDPVDPEDFSKFWNFSEWTIGVYEGTRVIDGLTVVGKVEVDKNNKTIEDVQYTQRMKSGGKSSWNSDGTPKARVFSFDVPGSVTVDIAMCSSSGDDLTRVLTVYSGDNNNVLGTATAAASPVVETFEYNGDATTIMIDFSGGINLYFIRVTGKESVGVEEVEVVGGEAVYYNLQGVRVDNPSNGIFIKVENGKVSKVAIR